MVRLGMARQCGLSEARILMLVLAVVVDVRGVTGGDGPAALSHEPLVAINAGGASITTTEGLVYGEDRCGSS